MTIVYTQNFDSVTGPALPSGWVAQGGSTWTTTSTGALSSPNALIGAADSTDILYTGYSTLADMEVRYDLNGVSTGTGFIAPLLRASSDDQNYYVFYPEYQGNINNIWTLYKKISGSFTAIRTFSLSGKTGTGPNEFEYSIRARIVGTSLYFKIWGFGETEPGAWDFTDTDSSVSAAGYPGLRYQFPSSGTGAAVADNFTLDNTLLPTLSVSPSSVIQNSTGNSLNLTGTGTAWTPGTPGSPTFAASGGAIIAQTVSSTTSATLTYSAPSSAGTVTLTDPSTAATATLMVNATTATDFSLTPSSLSTFPGAATGNYTIIPNGTPSFSTTIALSDGGHSGTFTPSWLAFTTSMAQTFTYTPNASDPAGTITLTATASGGLTTSHTTNCVLSSGSQTLNVTNSALFWSQGSWDHLTSGTFDVSTDTMQATAPGAYLKFNVSGTVNLALVIDNSTNSSFPSGDMPIVRYSIDAAAFMDVQLAPSQTSLMLSSSLSTTLHSVEVYFKASSSTNNYADVWGSSGVSPTNVLRVNGITIDGGGSVSAATPLSKRMLIFGDSITAGEHANIDGSDDATQSFAPMLARALGAEFAQLGYGGQGWTVIGNSNVAAFINAWNLYSVGRSRSMSGYDYIAVVHGGNDARASVSGSTIQSDVEAWLWSVRSAAGDITEIFVIVECMGAYESNISAAVAAYKTSSSDAKVYFVDATELLPSGVFGLTFGETTEWTYDGVHPLVFGHGRIGACYAAAAQSAMSATTLSGYSRSRVVNT